MALSDNALSCLKVVMALVLCQYKLISPLKSSQLYFVCLCVAFVKQCNSSHCKILHYIFLSNHTNSCPYYSLIFETFLTQRNSNDDSVHVWSSLSTCR